MKKCDKCGKEFSDGAIWTIGMNKRHLCFSCHDLWREDCKTNGIQDEKTDKLWETDRFKWANFWNDCFDKFINKTDKEVVHFD